MLGSNFGLLLSLLTSMMAWAYASVSSKVKLCWFIFVWNHYLMDSVKRVSLPSTECEIIIYHSIEKAKLFTENQFMSWRDKMGKLRARSFWTQTTMLIVVFDGLQVHGIDRCLLYTTLLVFQLSVFMVTWHIAPKLSFVNYRHCLIHFLLLTWVSGAH